MAVYNTKFEDLTKEAQTMYLSTLDRIGKDTIWGGIALTLNPAEDWNTKGFGCFDPAKESTRWFVRKVDGLYRKYLSVHSNNTDVTSIDNINDEIDKLYDRINTLTVGYNELEKRVKELEDKLNGTISTK